MKTAIFVFAVTVSTGYTLFSFLPRMLGSGSHAVPLLRRVGLTLILLSIAMLGYIGVRVYKSPDRLASVDAGKALDTLLREGQVPTIRKLDDRDAFQVLPQSRLPPWKQELTYPLVRGVECSGPSLGDTYTATLRKDTAEAHWRVVRVEVLRKDGSREVLLNEN